MKKFTRILCITLSVIMAFAIIATAIACDPPVIDEDVKISYYRTSNAKIAEYTVKKGDKITDDKMPSDPIPAADKKFAFWSDKPNGTVDFVANSTPSEKETKLYAVFTNRAEGEVVVSFDSDGGTRVPSVVLQGSGKVTKPASNPTLKDAQFRYWKSTTETTEFKFADTVITKDTVIKAIWNEGEGKILVVSSNDFDKVFSPFFSTSGDDASVYSQTHVSMLSADASGEVYVGEDVPSVVKAYRHNTFVGGNTEEHIDNEGKIDATPYKDNPDLYHTDYEFVIKNGIKFADGTDLTIKDVLFNMYVYLDPVYSGSNTMYSTNIIGLNDYRVQEEGATEDDNSTVVKKALERVYERWGLFFQSGTNDRDIYRASMEPEDKDQLLEDVIWMRKEFWKELQTDWLSLTKLGSEDLAKSYEQYGFTEVWQAFLLNCGMLTVKYKNDGSVDKTYNKEGYVNGILWNDRDKWHREKDDLIKIIFNNYAGIYTGDDMGNYLKDQPGKPVVDLIFDEAGEIIGNTLDSETLKNRIMASAAPITSNATKILYSWQAGSKLYTMVLNELKTESFENLKVNGEFIINTVKGITVDTLKKGESFIPQGQTEAVSYNEDHYVLKVSIAGVDPKALWNFGFVVAPMHYYSNPEGKDTIFTSADGYKSFSYPGVPKANGQMWQEGDPIHLGFARFNDKYIEQVMKEARVLGLPMGAGAFVATDSNNSEFSQVKPTTFFENNMVYFKRNTRFESTGTAMNNVKFERMQYKVVESTRVIDSLVQREVDLADPNAKEQIVGTAERTDYLTPVLVDNNGYGYVGVNAEHVPDIEIRRAIMTALNTELIKSYYSSRLASILERPMSRTNWAYPDDVEQRYQFLDENKAKAEIEKLVAAAGQNGESTARFDGSTTQNGAWSRLHDNGKIVDLSFVFTVAGSTTDHPAYQMFQKAAELLNSCGFKITVKNDPQALSKLSSGLLEVWAAAWQAGIDPDMYQLYHYKSQAQAVKNWGYPYLMDQGFGTDYETTIIKNLAKWIEDGRSTLKQDARKAYYKDALELVMDLAVEYPIYQRKNLTVYNNKKIDPNTVNQNPSVYSGVINYIWTVRLL